jgi:hypothetical protein
MFGRVLPGRLDKLVALLSILQQILDCTGQGLWVTRRNQDPTAAAVKDLPARRNVGRNNWNPCGHSFQEDDR